MKKIILGLGTLGAVVAPVALTVACGGPSDPMNTAENNKLKAEAKARYESSEPVKGWLLVQGSITPYKSGAGYLGKTDYDYSRIDVSETTYKGLDSGGNLKDYVFYQPSSQPQKYLFEYPIPFYDSFMPTIDWIKQNLYWDYVTDPVTELATNNQQLEYDDMKDATPLHQKWFRYNEDGTPLKTPPNGNLMLYGVSSRWGILDRTSVGDLRIVEERWGASSYKASNNLSELEAKFVNWQGQPNSERTSQEYDNVEIERLHLPNDGSWRDYYDLSHINTFDENASYLRPAITPTQDEVK